MVTFVWMKRVFNWLFLASFFILASCKDLPDVPQDGDIVFQESTSRQSPIIKTAQHSKWTHCGIVFHIGEKAYVFEAVEPVKYTLLEDWISRGRIFASLSGDEKDRHIISFGFQFCSFIGAGSECI